MSINSYNVLNRRVVSSTPKSIIGVSIHKRSTSVSISKRNINASVTKRRIDSMGSLGKRKEDCTTQRNVMNLQIKGGENPCGFAPMLHKNVTLYWLDLILICYPYILL
jgi:hypothetical protein